MNPKTNLEKLKLRQATREDIPSLAPLIERSTRVIGGRLYTGRQVESGLRYMFHVDEALIAEGTYSVAEMDGRIVGAGGWSRMFKLFHGEPGSGAGGEKLFLQPPRDPARIRAFFVDPDWTRCGIARRLFERCVAEASAQGFLRLELMATLPGEPLYTALGFSVIERVEVPLPDGITVPCVRMTRTI